MSVPPILEKIKGSLLSDRGKEFALILIILLVASVGFLLGMYAERENNDAQVYIVLPPESDMKEQKAMVISASEYVGQYSKSEVQKNIQETYGAFVASKNGKKYYPFGCSAANRIKEGNRVWYKTEEDAQNAGLTRSTSCK